MHNESPQVNFLAKLLVSIQFTALAILAALATIRFSSRYIYANIALIILALYILWRAYVVLKPSLRVNPIPKEGAEYIQIGIYSRIRHPMYVAVILVGLALSGMSSNKAGVVIMMALIINMLVKANLEDRLLLRRHPEFWEYQSQVPAFIPCRCK